MHERLVIGLAAGMLATVLASPSNAQGLVLAWDFSAGGGFNDCVVDGSPNELCGQTGVTDVTQGSRSFASTQPRLSLECPCNNRRS
jgi:hypothetical protein